MSKVLVLQELAVVLAIRNNNPMLIANDFLKLSNITPTNWELARQPVTSNQASQVLFRNGVGIVSRPDRIIFSEPISGKEVEEMQSPAIARRFIETLPNLEYQAVGTNLRGYITANQEEQNQNYIINTLMASGAWQQIGKEPVKAEVQLQFTLEQCQLSLSINDGVLYLAEQETVPIVLFTGTFSYAMQGASKEEQLRSLQTSLNNWREDLETYQDIINSKFLQSTGSQEESPQLSAALL